MKSMPRSLGAACVWLSFCLPSVVVAQTIASLSFDWKSLTIKADGNLITPTWKKVLDGPYFTYRLNGGVEQFQFEDISNPDIEANTNTQLLDVAPFGTATAIQSPTEVSISANNQFTSDFNLLSGRTAEFKVPISGNYTFTVNYTGSLEINNTNTELTGDNAASLVAFMRYTKNGALSNDPNSGGQDGNFRDDTKIFIRRNNVGQETLNGFLSITQTYNNNPVHFTQGDTIKLDLFAQVQNRSFSSQPPPVLATPIPAALPLILSGLTLLIGCAKKRSRV